MTLVGKCAVVYSGARGIGRGYCEALLQMRCKVYFGDILVEEGLETAKELQDKNKDSTIKFIKCDVLIDADVKALLNKAIADCGKVDIVIANTGTIDENDWERCLQLNLGSIMRVYYVTLAHMSKANGGKGGDFIATSSIAGLRPTVSAPVYSATKHAIVGFVRSWGTEFNYKLTNIRCNCICPFWVTTKLLLDIKPEQFLMKEHAQRSKDRQANLKSGDRYISTDDVGRGLIAVLEDDKANGQCMIVNKEGIYYAKFLEEAM